MQPRTMRVSCCAFRILQFLPLRIRWFFEGYQVVEPVLNKLVAHAFATTLVAHN